MVKEKDYLRELQKEQWEFYKSQNKIYKAKSNNMPQREKIIRSIISLIVSVLITLLLGYAFFGRIPNNNLKTVAILIIFILIYTVSNYLFLKDLENFRFWMNLFVSGLLVCFIMFGQLSVSSIQSNISATQNQILQQTSQSNLADILLVTPLQTRNLVFNKANLIYPRIGTIPIAITNLGKATAPSVRVSIVSPGFTGDINGRASALIVENLKSLDYSNQTMFSFWVNPEAEKTLSIGMQELTFLIDCPYCKDKLKNQTISICIYNQSSSECEEIKK